MPGEDEMRKRDRERKRRGEEWRCVTLPSLFTTHSYLFPRHIVLLPRLKSGAHPRAGVGKTRILASRHRLLATDSQSARSDYDPVKRRGFQERDLLLGNNSAFCRRFCSSYRRQVETYKHFSPILDLFSSDKPDVSEVSVLLIHGILVTWKFLELHISIDICNILRVIPIKFKPLVIDLIWAAQILLKVQYCP